MGFLCTKELIPIKLGSILLLSGEVGQIQDRGPLFTKEVYLAESPK